MKKKMKLISCILIMLMCVMSTSVSYAAPPNAKVNKVYMKQVKRLYNKSNQRSTMYKMYDFNKDKVKELVVAQAAGARGNYCVYTYKKGKAVKLTKKNYSNIGRLKGTKYIVGILAGGSAGDVYEVYVIKGKKIKLIDRYMSEYNYETEELFTYKNNRYISREKFNKFVNRIRYFDMKEY